MIGGLLVKAFREVAVVVLLFGLGLFVMERLLTFIVPQLQGQFSEMLEPVFAQMPFVRTFLGALLGVELGDQIESQLLQAFVWVHPAVLALVWGSEIVVCTRVPAGEIDRGTVDLLLGLPVSRTRLFVAETIVWLAAGIVVIGLGALGYALGARYMDPADRPGTGVVLLVLANLMCVYVAVGGMTLLVSSLSSRRGRAIGIAFAIVVGSFLLNFLAQYWEPAQRVAFLGVLHWYQPALVMEQGRLPIVDVAVLLGFGAVTWLAAWQVFQRRAIATL